jgi:hypothetical protein
LTQLVLPLPRFLLEVDLDLQHVVLGLEGGLLQDIRRLLPGVLKDLRRLLRVGLRVGTRLLPGGPPAREQERHVQAQRHDQRRQDRDEHRRHIQVVPPR